MDYRNNGKVATIRRIAGVLEISADGEHGINDNQLLYELKQRLRYTYVTFQYNKQSKPNAEERVLYAVDDKGRLVCQAGWYRAVCDILTSHGYGVRVIDLRKMPDPSVYEPDWDNLTRHFSFRPGQRECILRVASCIKNREGGIIEAAPAFGKTKVVSMLCALYPKAKIDIITHGNDLIADLYRHILAHTTDVGCICGGSRSNNRISIISSLSMRYSSYNADIVFADEVHRLMTDRAAAELAKYNCPCMFGFTATKETRLDNHHKRMEGLFGPTIFDMMWHEAESAGLIVPIIVEWWASPEGPAVSKYFDNMVAKKRNAFWRNHARNRLIAEAAMQHYTAGRQTLVLVETVEHLLHLYKLLPEFAVCFAEDWRGSARLKRLVSSLGVTLPTMSPRERMKTKAAFEQRGIMGAIATPVWATGVSFDGLQVLVRGDGGGSQTNNHQWPGRVARIDPNTQKQCGILVDFRDTFDPWAATRYKMRRRTYIRNGWSEIDADRSG